MSSLIAQSKLAVRSALPTLSLLVLMLFEFLPYRLAHIQAVMPHLFLAGAFYWALHRPDLMTGLILFMLGLFYDLANGGSLGFTAAALVVMRYFVISQRRALAGRAFILSWLGFVSVAFFYDIIRWLLLSLANEGSIDATIAAIEILMTISVYPVVARVLGQMHRRTLDP